MSCSSCSGGPSRANGLNVIQLVPGRIPKPGWLTLKMRPPNARFNNIKGMVKELGIATVCQEAMCPNISECWGGGTATFMLMGDTCTRACRFCNVSHGKPKSLDPDEPEHLAVAIGKLNLDYAVITCVDRDDVEDGGAAHFAKCITHLRACFPQLLVEVLVSDFQGSEASTQKVIDAAPHVYAHNIETVRRLQNTVRDRRANYEQSLAVLAYVKKSAPKMRTKSSIMAGLGEKPEEVLETMRDLRKINVDFLTIGQYLRPSQWNLPVVEYINPELYKEYEKKGRELGFLYVAAGPYVRSSYKAGEYYKRGLGN